MLGQRMKVKVTSTTMILGAIEALDEKAGSNKTAISKYLESKYAEKLPEAHSSLLTAHLERMKESGEILMVKNNYLKPGDVPVKARPRPASRQPQGRALARRRGEASEGIPRPRGRPAEES
ncbi:uncharacterized protein A4U43_C08F24120 [Asparagus officinalis]|nr:uncharacterized protein A4U43_C08F24120 [Asparagus officinalis]